MDVIKRYIVIAIIFGLLTATLSIIVFMPPTQNPPKGPITINAGPSYDPTLLNNTNVIINIPARTITVEVTFNVDSNANTDYISVMLPYTILSYSAYGIYNGNSQLFSSKIGNLTNYAMNTPIGSSITNATLELNETSSFLFFPNNRIGIGLKITVKESLFSIEDLLGGSKTAIYTFYGDISGIWTDNMSAYMGSNTFPTFNEPFRVQIALPSSYYYTSSQPPPIEYYVKQNNKWIMFSMDFLNGRYAQTLVCNLENPTYQSLRELLIFLIGVFSTLSITFALQAWTSHKEKEENIDHE